MKRDNAARLSSVGGDGVEAIHGPGSMVQIVPPVGDALRNPLRPLGIAEDLLWRFGPRPPPPTFGLLHVPFETFERSPNYH
jgi:hypothetical protein